LNGTQVWTTTGITQVPDASTTALDLGRAVWDSQYTTAILSDARVYNRALAPAEIEALAASRLKYHSITNGLVAYWPLDDQPDGTSGNGDTFRDRSGNANHGTGDDGGNNTGLTARAETLLSYPP